MEAAAAQVDPAGLGPADVASILGWWKLAGVDTVVGADPQSWFDADAQPLEQLTPGPEPLQSAPHSLPAAGQDRWWEPADSLQVLASAFAQQLPGAPFADGNPQSGLMIVGEAPSAEDLRTGRPFTGPAGILLDRMLAAIGVDRSSCYITLLCPRRAIPGMPTADEIAADLPLTRRHIQLAQPRLLLLLGANPVQALTGDSRAITQLRGTWLTVDPGTGDVPALATFNPAYLLRRPEEKAKAWADLLALKHRISQ